MYVVNFFFSDGDDDTDFEGTDHSVQVPRTPQINGDNTTALTKLKIEGMSCQSCVNNIQNIIGQHNGVLHIRVVLEECAGYIEYDEKKTTINELIEAIENMGFDATLYSPEIDNIETRISTCSIHIDGMTCQSCVNSITGKNLNE